MKFKNVSPMGDLDVPVLGRTVAFGEVVEVPAEVGVSFGEQPDVWAPVSKKESD